MIRCHLGQTILYDTVANLSWSVSVTHHSINTVVDTILAEPWLPAVEIGREVPVPTSEEDCVVRCLSFVGLSDRLTFL